MAISIDNTFFRQQLKIHAQSILSQMGPSTPKELIDKATSSQDCALIALVFHKAGITDKYLISCLLNKVSKCAANGTFAWAVAKLNKNPHLPRDLLFPLATYAIAHIDPRDKIQTLKTLSALPVRPLLLRETQLLKEHVSTLLKVHRLKPNESASLISSLVTLGYLVGPIQASLIQNVESAFKKESLPENELTPAETAKMLFSLKKFHDKLAENFQKKDVPWSSSQLINAKASLNRITSSPILDNMIQYAINEAPAMKPMEIAKALSGIITLGKAQAGMFKPLSPLVNKAMTVLGKCYQKHHDLKKGATEGRSLMEKTVKEYLQKLNTQQNMTLT